MSLHVHGPAIPTKFLGCWRGFIEESDTHKMQYACSLQFNEAGGISNYRFGRARVAGTLAPILPPSDPLVLSETFCCIAGSEVTQVGTRKLQLEIDSEGRLHCRWVTGRHGRVVASATMTRCNATEEQP